MSIPVTCQCGQRFAANDQLAGKTVKCPKCGGALYVAAPETVRFAPLPAADPLSWMDDVVRAEAAAPPLPQATYQPEDLVARPPARLPNLPPAHSAPPVGNAPPASNAPWSPYASPNA